MIAKSDQDADILAAQQYVIQHNLGDVLSQSFGEGEVCQASSIFTATHQLFVQAAAERMSVFASAGDSGSSQPACNGNGFFKSAGTPASDPLVTGVGGTHLNADLTTGAYEGETVWNDSGTNIDLGATCGGFSTQYLRPSYQFLANHSAFRGVPDVAWNADVFNGVLATCSECGPGCVLHLRGHQLRLAAVGGDHGAGRPGSRPPARLPEPDAVRHRGLHRRLLRLPRRHQREQRLGWGRQHSGLLGRPGLGPTTGLGSPNAANLINLLSQGRG